MHLLNNRTRTSKIYSEKAYNIAINNDRSHQRFLQTKILDQKVVQQKKLIEKIFHGVIKERMFGKFMSDDNRLSVQNYLQLDQICKQSMNKRVKALPLRSLHRTIQTSEKTNRFIKKQFSTIDMNKTGSFFNRKMKASSIRKRQSLKDPYKLMPSFKETEMQKSIGTLWQKTNTAKDIKGDKLLQLFHHKKLVINQKHLAQNFKKWAGTLYNQLLYDLKLTRDMVYIRIKPFMHEGYMQRFFNFFGFPNQFGLKQYISLIQNAANSNLRFIYFWVFVLLDQNGSGFLTLQDLFHFLQNISDSTYIEKQVYEIARWIQKRQGKLQQVEPPAEELLTLNRNLRLQQLKQMLKQTTKNIIQVNCTKNTCYHKTILSLQHDHLSRVQLNQLQTTQEATKKYKKRLMEGKYKDKTQPGIRLRDFHSIFGTRRPKIFCYFIALLTSLSPQDYQ